MIIIPNNKNLQCTQCCLSIFGDSPALKPIRMRVTSFTLKFITKNDKWKNKVYYGVWPLSLQGPWSNWPGVPVWWELTAAGAQPPVNRGVKALLNSDKITTKQTNHFMQFTIVYHRAHLYKESEFVNGDWKIRAQNFLTGFGSVDLGLTLTSSLSRSVSSEENKEPSMDNLDRIPAFTGVEGWNQGQSRAFRYRNPPNIIRSCV